MSKFCMGLACAGVVFAAVLAGLSCRAARTVNKPLQVRFGEWFWLGEGESARIDGLVVTFTKVLADSRCPPDVQCVWAGDVTTLVAVQLGEEHEEFTLHIGPQGARARFGRREISIAEVVPTNAPRAGAGRAEVYRLRMQAQVAQD